MDYQFLLSIAGNSFAFLGGLLLAVDVIRANSRYRQALALSEESDDLLAGLKLTVDGVAFKKNPDAILFRRASKTAIIGSLLLTLGFLLQTAGTIAGRGGAG